MIVAAFRQDGMKSWARDGLKSLSGPQRAVLHKLWAFDYNIKAGSLPALTSPDVCVNGGVVVLLLWDLQVSCPCSLWFGVILIKDYFSMWGLSSTFQIPLCCAVLLSVPCPVGKITWSQERLNCACHLEVFTGMLFVSCDNGSLIPDLWETLCLCKLCSSNMPHMSIQNLGSCVCIQAEVGINWL